MVNFHQNNTDIILYKYMKKQHARQMLEQGMIYINILGFFKDEDNLGKVIGDNNEGITREILKIERKNEKVTHKEFEFFKGTDVRYKSITFDNVSFDFIKNKKYFNTYLYCMSTKFDRNILEAFNADVCIEISNPKAFFEIVMKELSKEIFVCSVLPCIYEDRIQVSLERDYKERIELPCIIKDPHYEYQQEVRALFFPKKGMIAQEPLIKYCPQVKEFIRIKAL